MLDIVVHRLLYMSLQNPKPEPSFTSSSLQELAEHMNMRHACSRRGQKDATKLFQVMYFQTQMQTADAFIYSFKKNGLLVHCPKFLIYFSIVLSAKVFSERSSVHER